MGFFPADAFLFPEKGRAFRPGCCETGEALIRRIYLNYKNVADSEAQSEETRQNAARRCKQIFDVYDSTFL